MAETLASPAWDHPKPRSAGPLCLGWRTCGCCISRMFTFHPPLPFSVPLLPSLPAPIPTLLPGDRDPLGECLSRGADLHRRVARGDPGPQDGAPGLFLWGLSPSALRMPRKKRGPTTESSQPRSPRRATSRTPAQVTLQGEGAAGETGKTSRAAVSEGTRGLSDALPWGLRRI